MFIFSNLFRRGRHHGVPTYPTPPRRNAGRTRRLLVLLLVLAVMAALFVLALVLMGAAYAEAVSAR